MSAMSSQILDIGERRAIQWEKSKSVASLKIPTYPR
jgi:hypothetical protein